MHLWAKSIHKQLPSAGLIQTNSTLIQATAQQIPSFLFVQSTKNRQTSLDRCSVIRESLKWDYLCQGIFGIIEKVEVKVGKKQNKASE